MQRVSEGKMTEEEGKQELLWYERRFCDNIERYGKFLKMKQPKRSFAVKGRARRKNLNAIRAMGVEV